jgi:predicted RNA-binding protein with EMAP domain
VRLILLSLQTPSLPPLLIGLFAQKKLKDSFNSKLGFKPSLAKDEISNVLKSIESSLMILKYSYLSLEELKDHEEVKNLQKSGRMLAEAIKPVKSSQTANQFVIAVIYWGILILNGMKRRIKTSDSQLGAGVDLKVLCVRNTQKRGDFLLTRAYDDIRAYTIMTNILKLQTNQTIAAAFLPPREIDGQLSEAMYLGSEERTEKIGTYLAPNQVNLKEVNGILHQLLQ